MFVQIRVRTAFVTYTYKDEPILYILTLHSKIKIKFAYQHIIVSDSKITFEIT